MTDHVQESETIQKNAKRAKRWLSKDLASLVLEQVQNPRPYDVVIVGSGYGGAMAAAELAGCRKENGEPVRVCVLERGKEYLPGAFPSSLAELPAHVRYTTARSAQAKGPWDGLFDLRLGNDVASLVANGLGGGSLINAAVMEIPDWKHFDSRMLPGVKADLTEEFYEQVKKRLGAHVKVLADYEPLAKTEALRNLAHKSELHFRPASLTIADPERKSENGRLTPRLSQASVPLSPCLNCGDCMTGCNVGARESLDTNLLVQARDAGAEIYTGAAVLKLSPAKPGSAGAAWTLEVVPTDAQMRKRERPSLFLQAAKVIIAAGTFGSTEILMRSRSDDEDGRLQFSGRLGQQFSCNGDNMALVYGGSSGARTVADEHQPFHQRQVGPTITGVVEVPADAIFPRFLMQEFAVPAALKRVFEELATTACLLHELDVKRPAAAGDDVRSDPCAIDAAAVASSVLIGFIGHDSGLGVLHLPDKKKGAQGSERPLPGEGVLQVEWPEARKDPRLVNNLEHLGSRIPAGAQVLPNPLWKLLPAGLIGLVNQPLGPVLTVHPLGGCAMGNSASTGVVNQWGQVYRGGAGSEEVFDDLMVLDGAIIPSSLGANPALTIAALALRAVTHLRCAWKWRRPDSQGTASSLPRPRSRTVQECQPALPVATEVRLVERLRGPARLRLDGTPGDYMIELTLCYKPQALSALTTPAKKLLVLDEQPAGDDPASRLRIYHLQDWQKRSLEFADDGERERVAFASVPLRGELTLLQRKTSGRLGAVRAGLAWLINRGARDVWQRMMGMPGSDFRKEFRGWAKSMVPLSYRAAEVRCFDYRLEVLQPGGPFRKGQTITGGKRFTYGRRANPFRQLAQLHLDEFPLHVVGTPAVLDLDLRFITRERLPLMRVTAQESQVSAMADFFAFAMYMGRMMLGHHLWSFRKPDDPSAETPQRLPGPVKGLPMPEVFEIELGRVYNQKVLVRLTRYARRGAPPLVMIHGYSASGTTFAHDAIPCNMAKYFHDRGRDIWILDLRTSAGMPTAWYKWDYEDAAFADIPVAIDYIYRTTGKQVDVFAHCIGAVMVGMGLLTDHEQIEEVTADFCRPMSTAPRRYGTELGSMQKAIRSLVLSQKGPALAYTESNVLRAYLAAYLQRVLLPRDYAFRRQPDPSIAEQFLDRMLSALPYPEEEFDIENPSWPFWKRTDWVGTRHRMDVLYGRDFSLRNISETTLAHIDDLFGPLNLDTVAQTAFLARYNRIANAAGECAFLSRANLQRCWTGIPTLSVHGRENGLADVETLNLMKDVMQDAQVPFSTMCFDGYGHQDMLIGRNADRDIFPCIERFLTNPQSGLAQPSVVAETHASTDMFALPWLGPRIAPDSDGQLALWVGADPSTPVTGIVCIPVHLPLNGRHYGLAAGGAAVEVQPYHSNKPGWRSASWPVMPDSANLVLVLLVPESQARPGHDNFSVELPLADAAPVTDMPARRHRREMLGPEQLMRFLRCMSAEQLASAVVGRPAWERAKQAGVDGMPGNASVSIAFGSCQYPTGLFDRPLAQQSFRRLEESLQRTSANSDPAPSLLLLLGDQVYVDATAGMLDPTRRDAQYLQPYQAFYRMAPLRGILREIPMRSMLDDHEIIDNWEPVPQPASKSADLRRTAGLEAYWRWQRPGSGTGSDSLYYSFKHSGLPIFMTDTRSDRMPRTSASIQTAQIMHPRQMHDLRHWLLEQHRANPDCPKLVAGPAMLLPRRLGAAVALPEDCLRSDAWDGYPASLHQLLGFIACQEIRNVIFLSGDEHLANVACIDVKSPGGLPIRIHSLHTGGLYAPIPFANALPTDFRADDRFAFSYFGLRKIHVHVQTRFVQHGDGYTELVMRCREREWEVLCRFHQAYACEQVLLISDRAGASSNPFVAHSVGRPKPAPQGCTADAQVAGSSGAVAAEAG